MPDAAFTEGIDIAQVVLYAFWIFFAGLIFYLRREDRREGYPLVDDTTGKQQPTGIIFWPDPKPFPLESGGTAYAPASEKDRRDLNMVRSSPVPGSPYLPSGNPLKDGVGPAAWGLRADEPERDHLGHLKIEPMRNLPGWGVARQDPDPRGMPVQGLDKKYAGTVTDIWADKGDTLIRYLELELAPEFQTEGQPVNVLLPMTLCVVHRGRKFVEVQAITAAQFADVPRLKNPDQITSLEEEKVQAYYTGGHFYAIPSRQESWV
jgi:photosynthetic reaction center H subunit